MTAGLTWVFYLLIVGDSMVFVLKALTVNATAPSLIMMLAFSKSHLNDAVSDIPNNKQKKNKK